ncbi:hypothetical protein Pcinc_024279 [Petrolisthes cinctipes]|uniref:Uncharacterized protein n=1 Tax=Petrolisthes cinctipes TaxID=88211 RepID=A0AAE1KB12_PETCI|nr:hypothetical protein Pcinc_024279 [Petrolisthes cinctipes]
MSFNSPWRIVEDCGGAFALGTIGGGLFQSVNGFQQAPKGLSNRLSGSLKTVMRRAPVVGGKFASYGALFSAAECSLEHMRKKDDSWNSILSGATTGGILAARFGVVAMIGSAFSGGLLLSIIKASEIIVERAVAAKDFRPIPPHERTQAPFGDPK